MALNWTVTGIARHDRVTTAPYHREGQPQWHPATQALVWLSMHCGFSSITEKNLDEIADRIAVWEHYIGATMRSSYGELRVSRQDIEDHIGLSTNASTLNKREFWAKIRRIMEDQARLGEERIDTQLRRNSYSARVEQIESLVLDTELVPEDTDVRDALWHWFETTERIDLDDGDIASEVARSIAQA